MEHKTTDADEDAPQAGERTRAESIDSRMGRIVRQTLADQVYGDLKELLLAGRAAPGERFTLRGLASAIGTSAMPVREALRRLAAQRALEPMKSRSMRVPVLSVQRLHDIRRARVLVEGAAVEWAVERMSSAELADLRRLAGRIGRSLARPDALSEWVTSNQAFHFTIYRACGSESLLAMIENLWLQSGPCLRAARALMRPDERPPIELHAAIVEAFERRDVQGARDALEHDICWSFDLLLEHGIAPESAPARQRRRRPSTHA